MTKNRAFILIIIFLLTHSAIEIYAQDTIRNVSENTFDYVDSKYKNRKSALRASLYINAEDITLWSEQHLDGHTGYGISANYEFKFAKAHSINSGVKAYITNKKYENLRIFTSYRFYHNLKARISLGKTGDNFAANYFFIEPSLGIIRSPYRLSGYAWDFNRGEWALTYKKKVEQVLTVWMGYGLQRNVFKNFNVDANVGFNFQDGYFNTYSHPYFITQVSLGYTIH